MTDADHLDASRARSDHARCIIELRNDGVSWRQTARLMGCSVRIARDVWARENAYQRGDQEADTPTGDCAGKTARGDARKLRGLPVMAPGVTGVSPGTRPGDPSWPLDRDQRPRRRRITK